MYNKSDVTRFAKMLIDDMAESIAEMASDADAPCPVGDYTDTVRDHAMEYGADILDEFRAEVLREVQNMKFKAELKMVVDV